MIEGLQEIMIMEGKDIGDHLQIGEIGHMVQDIQEEILEKTGIMIDPMPIMTIIPLIGNTPEKRSKEKHSSSYSSRYTQDPCEMMIWNFKRMKLYDDREEHDQSVGGIISTY